ncbi:Tetratricopeptide repeat [Phytophthora cactorum]|nr:Tetratricopeptide repeat [Phytophthora cactorum]
MAPPPPTPCRPPAPSIRGSSWRQPSPVQTPDCTTRTLAFDSAASSAADEASVRAKKRRRRVDQAAAFITARRPLNTEQDEEQDEETQDAGQMWTLKSGEDAVRHPTHFGGHLEDNKQAMKPPLTTRKTTTSAQKDNRQTTVDRLRKLVKTCSAQHHAASALFYADKLVTMSPRNENDVLLFADACYLNRECMLAIKQKEECLELLGSVLPHREHGVVLLAKKVQQVNTGDEHTEGINVVASLALLMGETFEAIGNRENATYDTTPPVEERFAEVEHDFGLTDNLELKYEAAQRYFHPSSGVYSTGKRHLPYRPIGLQRVGSVYYKQKDYPNAIEMFTKALQLCKGLPDVRIVLSSRLMEAWEPTLFNLGYSYRKLRCVQQ